MSALYHHYTRMMLGVVMNQLILQQELIEAQRQLAAAQREVLRLERALKKKSPKNPPDKQTFWHLASGMFSTEAANSDDLKTVEQFSQWLELFARKNIKPYVNPKVYGECLNQMRRGIPERLAELETREEFRAMAENRLWATAAATSLEDVGAIN